MKEVGGTLDVGQWELHPWLQRDDIVSWCRERDVVVEAYCPLVRAQRSGEEVLKKLAGKYGKTWAQVLVRWSLQKVSSCFTVWGDTIAASISEEAETIEEVYEPYLIQLGFLNRTPRGRVATELAYDYFKVKPFARREDQPGLF